MVEDPVRRDTKMPAKDGEIERIARRLLAEYEGRAALVAAERLNAMIDRNNIRGRDIWACVVHAIHEQQGTGPSAGHAPEPNDLAARPQAAL
jgi:hypothetical protein